MFADSLMIWKPDHKAQYSFSGRWFGNYILYIYFTDKTLEGLNVEICEG